MVVLWLFSGLEVDHVLICYLVASYKLILDIAVLAAKFARGFITLYGEDRARLCRLNGIPSTCAAATIPSIVERISSEIEIDEWLSLRLRALYIGYYTLWGIVPAVYIAVCDPKRLVSAGLQH